MNTWQAQLSSLGVLRTSLVLFAPLLAVAGLTLYGQACNCDETLTPIVDGPSEPELCDPTVPCAKENQVRRFDQCVASGCESDSDCCPGTRCRVDFNTCWPKFLDGEFSCEEDADCQDSAARCQDVVIGERDPLPVCSYDRCTGDLDCGPGRLCYHSVCVNSAPCGGSCPDGEVCDVLTNTCSIVGDGAVGCDQECDGLRVLADPDVMRGEVCCGIVCQCKGLPPLVPSRYGKYSSIALAGDAPKVSAYDNEYGDLVLLHYEKDGTLNDVEYVDGAPATGEVVADPTGPRNGIAEPGPNVGTHTSIVADTNGKVRIAYYDLDQRALKVAVQTDAGWNVHVVDTPTDEGSVGMFTDIAIHPQTQLISISYLATNQTGAPSIAGLANGLKVASSVVAEPASATDWQISFVDMRENKDACNGSCSVTQACVLGGGEPSCLEVSTNCGSSCSDNETCVFNGNQSESICALGPTMEASEQRPDARGLHSSITVSETATYIAYYDSIDGTVRLSQLNGSDLAGSWVIDGDGVDGRVNGNVGLFPSIGESNGEIHIVYTDFSNHQVRHWHGAPGAEGTRSTVDFGLEEEAAGQRFVGGGASLAMVNDRGVVVYQDASHLNLMWAEQNENGWDVATLLAEGAQGFYSDLAVSNDSAFIVSVMAELDGRTLEHPRVGLVIRSLPGQ